MKHEMCSVCSFDGSRYSDQAVLAALRGLGSSLKALLGEASTNLRVRPEPDVRSAIEYAANSRVITAQHVFGVQQALTLDEPSFPPLGDDLAESAVAPYEHADPDQVGSDLASQASLLADLADDPGTATRARGLTIGDNRNDIRRLLEHALHDSHHHLGDVEAGLSLIRERGP